MNVIVLERYTVAKANKTMGMIKRLCKQKLETNVANIQIIVRPHD